MAFDGETPATAGVDPATERVVDAADDLSHAADDISEAADDISGAAGEISGAAGEMTEAAEAAEVSAGEIRRHMISTQWATPAWLELAGRWAWNLLLVGLVLYLAADALVVIRFVVLPALIALMAASFLSPLRRPIAARTSEGVAAGSIVLLATIVIVGAISGATALIARALTDTERWEQTRSQIRVWLRNGPADLTTAEIEDLERRAERWLTNGIGQVDTDRVLYLGQLVAGIVLTVLLLFFFMKEGPTLWRWVTDRLRPERRAVVHRAGLAAFDSLGGYVRGVALTGLVDAILIGAALYLLGVPLVLPLAVLTFAAAFFPIVGAATAGGLAAVVALIWNGPATALAVVVVVALIQQLEGNVMMPLLLRRRVSLHPAVILTALAVGGGLGGIAGAFVAVPVAAMTTAAMATIRQAGPTPGRAGATRSAPPGAGPGPIEPGDLPA